MTFLCQALIIYSAAKIADVYAHCLTLTFFIRIEMLVCGNFNTVYAHVHACLLAHLHSVNVGP